MFAATLLVDASWCPETGVAGYGYWIACNRGKVGGGAPLDGLVSSSNLAEMHAICNALDIGWEKELLQHKDTILIQTDCMAAIIGLNAERPLNDDENRVHGKFLMLTRGINYSFRHVKGHTGRYEARYSSNYKCDKRAKIEMREARAKFLSGDNLETYAR